MSFDPVLWAMKDAPIADVEEFAVLLCLAETADEDGEGAFPAVGTIAERVHLSERTVQRRLASLSSRRLIARGDQSRAAYLPRDKRPTVYDLMVPYEWFPRIDRTNRYRMDRGRIPLSPEMRPKIADYSPGCPPVTPSSEPDGVTPSPPRGVPQSPEPPLSSYGTKTSPTAKSAEADSREDVDHLCVVLADLVESNGSKRPTITKAWKDAARLMIDRDGRDPVKAEALIRWCQADEFWRGNVLSMPKFRAQYDRLRLRALAEWEKNHGGGSGGNSFFRPDGEVDAYAVLGHEPWSLPTIPEDVVERMTEDPAVYQEWARSQSMAWQESRRERAREVLKERGYAV